MRKILAVSLSAALSFVSISFAACPSADLTGDYFVNFEDYAVPTTWWLEDCNSLNHFCEGVDFDLSGQVDPNDLAILAGDWSENYAFVTTWDTSSVIEMRYMFYTALSFNQDLSGWCVELITTEPVFFDFGARSWTLPNWRPHWGADCL